MRINSSQFRLAKSIFLCSLLLCCRSIDAAAFQQERAVVAQNDPTPPQQVIIRFLKWYKINLNKANNFPLLIKDSANNFIVNKTASTDYLNFLKTSQCISQKYIEYWSVFFNDKATELIEHPNQSDIPEGFDIDFVLITQEPELLLEQIGRIKFKTISANASVALIGLKFPGKNSMEYEFEMYKSKAGWQIGYISSPNYD